MAYRERGFAFLPFLLGNWQLIGYGIAIMAVVGFVWNCERVKTNYQELIASMKVAAQENDKRVKIAIAQAKKDKEKADNENKVSRSRIASLSSQLRDARSGSYLPPATAGSASPATITLDRTALDAAIRRLDAGVQGLIDEGDQAVIDLDTAKRWAQ